MHPPACAACSPRTLGPPVSCSAHSFRCSARLGMHLLWGDALGRCCCRLSPAPGPLSPSQWNFSAHLSALTASRPVSHSFLKPHFCPSHIIDPRLIKVTMTYPLQTQRTLLHSSSLTTTQPETLSPSWYAESGSLGLLGAHDTLLFNFKFSDATL